MSKKKFETVELKLDKIVGGGQALGTLPDGRKLFVWGGLPGELVKVQLTKKKANFAEGTTSEVITSSPERIEPLDPGSYLSTSPWQIMSFEAEQHYKSLLINEAFQLHNVPLPTSTEIYSDNNSTHYRNKVEFSWYSDSNATSGVDTLDLAFFRRGSKGKIIVETSALLPPEIITLAHAIRDQLRLMGITARELKTLLIRCDQDKNCVWQLYVKDGTCGFAESLIKTTLPAQGGEIIYSDPRSPASVITKRLVQTGNIVLEDHILGVPFRYATEGFFQVNIPVYEQALRDMRQWVDDESKVVDLYSGVGSIGLTIGGTSPTLVEINEHAVREMKQNITLLRSKATAVLAASEQALSYITPESLVIIDPPRAGLHMDVVQRLIEATPQKVLYLSCNPVTQARDIALLTEQYEIRAYKGYNFFPRTPHIEGLALLERMNH